MGHSDKLVLLNAVFIVDSEQVFVCWAQCLLIKTFSNSIVKAIECRRF